MSNWSTHQASHLVAIGDMLTAAPIAVHLVTDSFDWKPAVTSALERELRNTEHGPGGQPWTTGPVEQSRVHAQFWLILASAEFRGLGLLLKHDESLLASPWPVARAGLEKCAAGGWLVDPRVTTRQRAARGALVELEDRRHQRNLAAFEAGQEPGAFESPEQASLDEYRDTTLPLVFDPINVRGSRRHHIENEALPNYSALVESFADLYMRGGDGRQVYATLSGRAHPSVSTYRALFAPVHGGVSLRESYDNLVNLARLCAAAHYKFLAQTCEWYGWTPSAEVLAFWETAINAVLPGTIGP